MQDSITKQYGRTVSENKLVIMHDECMDSPREAYDNIGVMFCDRRNRYSPDRHLDEHGLIEDVVEETYDTCRINNAEGHARAIKRKLQSRGYKIKGVYPISVYEHSDITYYLGSSGDGSFDSGVAGFYVVFINDHTKNMRHERLEKCITAELKEYTAWANGECYEYLLKDDDGEILHGCSGFYDIEAIRAYLPEEYKNDDLMDYYIGV